MWHWANTSADPAVLVLRAQLLYVLELTKLVAQTWMVHMERGARQQDGVRRKLKAEAEEAAVSCPTIDKSDMMHGLWP